MGLRLTQRRIDAAKTPPAGQILIRDGELRGFALRVTATGCKTFVWDGRISRVMRRITLGRYPEFTLEEARTKALEIRHQIALGNDPAKERLEKRREPTVKELCDLYIERHARPHKRSWAEDHRKIRLHFSTFATLKISALTTEAIVRWHQRIGKERGQYMANRCLTLLATILNFAKTWGYLTNNLTKGVKRFREEKRERFLDAVEIDRLFAALADEPSPFWRAYFRLALLLGTRKNELLTARWDDINLTEAIWTIPNTKAGRSHTLPLPRAAVAILAELPSRNRTDWVFPSDKKPGQRLSRADDAWNRIRERAGITHARIHDLRRTLGSWLAAQGHSLTMIGKTLNHTNLATTQVYARLTLEPVREAL
jgi:integrase